MYDIDQSKIKRILINQPAFLGDAVMTSPLVAAVKEYFPDATVDMLCIPAAKAIWVDNPNISNILLFNKKSGMVKKIASFFEVLKTIRKNKYDCAISVQQSSTSSALLDWGNIPVTIGLYKQKKLTHGLAISKEMHVRHRHLAMMQAFTDKKFADNTQLYWNKETEAQAQKIVNDNRKNATFLIGMAPGSVWKTKRWLEEYWVELIQKLSTKSILPVLIGGKDEVELCNRIADKAGVPVCNLCGELSIQASAAVIDKLDLMLSNDSAPLHIANAVDTPVFAFFGPTVKKFGCYPYRAKDKMLEIELECRPCHAHGLNHCPEKHFKCMTEQKPDSVLPLILDFLDPHD